MNTTLGGLFNTNINLLNYSNPTYKIPQNVVKNFESLKILINKCAPPRFTRAIFQQIPFGVASQTILAYFLKVMNPQKAAFISFSQPLFSQGFRYVGLTIANKIIHYCSKNFFGGNYVLLGTELAYLFGGIYLPEALGYYLSSKSANKIFNTKEGEQEHKSSWLKISLYYAIAIIPLVL